MNEAEIAYAREDAVLAEIAIAEAQAEDWQDRSILLAEAFSKFALACGYKQVSETLADLCEGWSEQ